MYRHDTSKEVQEIYDQKIRALSQEERFLRGISLTHFCREICLSQIKEKYPQLTNPEIKAHFFEMVYGESFGPTEIKKISAILFTEESGE